MKKEKKKVKKIGRPPAEWLLNLKPGTYTMEELVEISKRDKTTIRMSLKLHGADVSYKQKGSLLIAVFKWEGFKD